MRSTLTRLGALAIAVLALSLVGMPEAFAALGAVKASALPSLHDVAFYGASVLVALRADLANLKSRAIDKLAEIKDDTAADVARTIEAEHADLVRQIEAKQAEITTAEATERTSPPPDVRAVSAEAARAAVTAERARAAEIRSIGATAEIEAEVIERAVNDGIGIDAFRKVVFDAMLERQKKFKPEPTAVRVTADEGGKMRRGIADALAFRMQQSNPNRVPGDEPIKLSAEGEGFRNLTIVEMAADFIGHRGNIRAHHVDDIMKRAMHTTSDFPGLLMDAMNRRLMSRYALQAPTYRRFSTRMTASDFRAQNVLRAGDFPTLKPVGESGEIKSGSFSESKEKFQVSAYGIKFGISRVMMVNDQLGAIDQMIGGYGDSVAVWENVQAFTLLLSNTAAGPTLLTDNTAMFHTDHGNLAGSGGAISVTTIGAGRAAMMKQTTLDGLPAESYPTLLLCSPDKITLAEQTLAPLTLLTPGTRGEVLPASLSRITPVADAQITGTPWYMFSDSSRFPTMAYGFLNGSDGPRFATQEAWNTQGMEVKVEHDFGVSGIDYRGSYRNPGA